MVPDDAPTDGLHTQLPEHVTLAGVGTGSSEYAKPLLHEQLLTEWLPMGESEPDGQSVHADRPDVIEYLPFIHCVQVADDEDPSVLEYFPASHGVQTTDDSNVEYVPRGHDKQ